MGIDVTPVPHPLVAEAIRACGSQQALAGSMGVKQQTVSKLLHRQLRIDADHAIAIDRATAGAVPRWKLRPDLFEAPAGAITEPVSRCPHCNEITVGRTECRHAGCELFPVATAEVAAA